MKIGTRDKKRQNKQMKEARKDGKAEKNERKDQTK